MKLFNLRSVGFLLILTGMTFPAFAHPLGNFSIGHYSRLRVTRDAIHLRYALDLAEIPTFQEMPQLDANGDHEVSADEKRAYLQSKVKEVASRLMIQVNGKSLTWQIESSDLKLPAPKGAAPTLLIVADLRAGLPNDLSEENAVFYEDQNYPQRAGWKEIVAQADESVRLLKSSAPLKDRSAELTQYPSDVTAPPQDVSAEFTFASGGGNGAASVPSVRHTTKSALNDKWLIGISGFVILTVSLLVRYRSLRGEKSPLM